MGHPQGYFLGSEYGGGMKVKVIAGDKSQEPEDGTMHMITEVTQNNSRIYGKSVVLKLDHALESPGGLLKARTAGPHSHNFCLVNLR